MEIIVFIRFAVVRRSCYIVSMWVEGPGLRRSAIDQVLDLLLLNVTVIFLFH